MVFGGENRQWLLHGWAGVLNCLTQGGKERSYVSITFVELIPDTWQFGSVDITGNQSGFAGTGGPAEPEDWALPPAYVDRVKKPFPKHNSRDFGAGNLNHRHTLFSGEAAEFNG
jgi:hypothetical protein